MAFNVNGLTTYVDQLEMELIRKMVLGGRTQRFVTVQPNVKSSDSINIISSSMFAAAGGCGFTSTGTTTLSQQLITVSPIKFQEELCLDTLENYYLQATMAPGSYQTELPFEQVFVDDKIANMSSIIDTMLWQGDTASATQNLSLMNGWIKQANTTYSGSVVTGNVGAVTSITPSNIIAIVDNAIQVIPTNVIAEDDLILYCGYDFARTYFTALRNANLFHYPSTADNSMDFEIVIPSTNVRLVAVKGLTGTNKFFITPKKNIFLGTDMLNDFEEFQMWYSLDNQTLRYSAKCKFGTAFAFPDYVVYFKL
jgi:hypothetical protein